MTAPSPRGCHGHRVEGNWSRARACAGGPAGSETFLGPPGAGRSGRAVRRFRGLPEPVASAFVSLGYPTDAERANAEHGVRNCSSEASSGRS